MTTLLANGIELSYDSWGDPHAQTILLIAGLGTQRIRWSESFCHMLVAKGYRVIRYDNRDAGGSTHFTACPTPDFGALVQAVAAGKQLQVPYTLHDMARDTVGLLDALGIAQAHVVGRSMGGMVAQIVAIDYPTRVLSLTSLMSSTGNPSLPSASPEVMAWLTQSAPHPQEDEAGFLAHGLAFARRLASPGFPFEEDAYRALLVEEIRRAYDPTALGRQLAAIAVTGDLRPALRRITAPSLVVHGADDLLVPAACGQDTANAIAGAEFMLIDGMGHDLPVPLHQQVADRIARVAQRTMPPE